ncbi:hypothetical protein EGW08_016690 [Elysia chlorotica]|uniref:Large proline-rich protein BAG6 n=1 Tax=Elysia chlorotica TaxID=188477 RepID=A0A3S1B427_ELYCH|nr:hypothetical protein EGW08_016690 [Elysia chlorotica]
MASSSSSTPEDGPDITLTVKTLDGKNRSFTLQENLTIKQFKEKISSTIEIPAETQRLIFQGRVMQDEKLLRDYDVNGKVIHLVQRAPPSSLSGTSPTSTSSSNSAPPPPPRRSESHVFHLGRVQQHPTSREARARLRQAEFNLGIINDALHLLEQRTGVTPEDLPGPDEAELRREDDMDLSSDAPASTEAGADTENTAATASTTPSEQGQQQQQPASGPGTAPPPPGANSSQDNTLNASELADFLDRVLRTNNRMVPHLRRYRNYLRSEENYSQTSQDRRNAQETVNRVNEALHAMSHMMHSLSDVMINMGTNHPRQGLAYPPSPFQLPGTASMSIPLQMNIRAARPSGNGNQAQQQTNQRQTGNTTATSASGPSVSEGSSTAGTTTTNTSSTAGTATGGLGGTTTTTFGPFQIPLGTIPFPGAANVGTANVIVEALPPQISVHNIGVIHTEEDLYGSSGESNDSNGSMESSVTVEASSAPEGRPPVTSSSGTQQSPAATTVSGQFGAVPGSASTSSFTFGPTTSVNVLPNVPGMPPGVLQNIIGTMLQQHGRGNQPVQVNVIRQTAGSTGPQQVIMDLPLDGHMDQHQQAHFQELRAHHFPMASSSDASQQASPSTVDASTATRSNAATNTQGSAEAATNTSTVRTRSTTAATNTDGSRVATTSVTTANVGVGGGINSSVGTGTEPGLGMSTTATNTPQIHVGINGRGRGIPISIRPPQFQGQPPRHHHHHHQQQGPNPAPPGTGASMNSVYADPYLFCHSHNYDSQSARSAYRALQARMRARGQQMPQPNQQVPNLSTMVSGLVGNIFGQAGQAFNVGQRPGAGTTANNATNAHTPGAATATSTANSGNPTPDTNTTQSHRATNSVPTSSAGPQMPAFNPMQMFANMFRPGAQPSNPPDISSIFGNLMQATRAQPTSGAASGAAGTSGTPPGGTLADMFTYFRPPPGEEQEAQTPSVLVSLLETVAPFMGLADLFSLVMGNTRVVGQLRRPLRDFVSGHLAVVDGNVEALVRSALDDMMPEIQHMEGLVQLRPGVDMAMSVCACLQAHLVTLFNTINSDSPSDNDEFGSNLYSLWMKMMAETIALCIYCIQDGDAGFSDMVQRYMPRMNQGMSPAITIWMTTSLQDILGSFHRNHPVSEAQIMRYVVRTDQSRPANSSSTSERKPNTSTNNVDQAAPASSAPAPMEVATESPSPRPPRAKAARTLPEEEESGEIFVDAQESLSRTAPEAAQSAGLQARPNSITTAASPATMAVRSKCPPATRNGNSDNWQSVIPQEWIPVINQDVARQRDQRPQPPLSDAYLQGLPAKRRRMMTVEHVGEMGNMSRYLPSALRRAARAARVEPISSEENLAREAADNLDLQGALEDEVTAVLETRVTSDTDFSSERFPNAKEYFHKSKRH